MAVEFFENEREVVAPARETYLLNEPPVHTHTHAHARSGRVTVAVPVLVLVLVAVEQNGAVVAVTVAVPMGSTSWEGPPMNEDGADGGCEMDATTTTVCLPADDHTPLAASCARRAVWVGCVEEGKRWS